MNNIISVMFFLRWCSHMSVLYLTEENDLLIYGYYWLWRSLNRVHVDTTSSSWAGFIPKERAWIPPTTCRRSSGTPAVSSSRSTFRPSVRRLWKHDRCIQTSQLMLFSLRSVHAAEPRHVRVQRQERIQTQTRVHETTGQELRPLHREHCGRHRSQHLISEGSTCYSSTSSEAAFRALIAVNGHSCSALLQCNQGSDAFTHAFCCV